MFHINPLFDLIFSFPIRSYATFCRNKLEFVVFPHFPFWEILNSVIFFHKAGRYYSTVIEILFLQQSTVIYFAFFKVPTSFINSQRSETKLGRGRYVNSSFFIGSLTVITILHTIN